MDYSITYIELKLVIKYVCVYLLLQYSLYQMPPGKVKKKELSHKIFEANKCEYNYLLILKRTFQVYKMQKSKNM